MVETELAQYERFVSEGEERIARQELRVTALKHRGDLKHLPHAEMLLDQLRIAQAGFRDRLCNLRGR
jgi:hypothetical protein